MLSDVTLLGRDDTILPWNEALGIPLDETQVVACIVADRQILAATSGGSPIG